MAALYITLITIALIGGILLLAFFDIQLDRVNVIRVILIRLFPPGPNQKRPKKQLWIALLLLIMPVILLMLIDSNNTIANVGFPKKETAEKRDSLIIHNDSLQAPSYTSIDTVNQSEEKTVSANLTNQDSMPQRLPKVIARRQPTSDAKESKAIPQKSDQIGFILLGFYNEKLKVKNFISYMDFETQLPVTDIGSLKDGQILLLRQKTLLYDSLPMDKKDLSLSAKRSLTENTSLVLMGKPIEIPGEKGSEFFLKIKINSQ